MKIRTEQLNPTIGDITGNTSAIVASIRQAEKDGIDLLLLPELAVCGYPPMDLLERPAFLESTYRANQKIIAATDRMGIIFGTVTPNPSGYGRKCFNAAVLAHKGEAAGEIHKTLLPTYDVFDDLRYFEPAGKFECVEFKGVKLGMTICEDIWYNENDIQYHTYEVNPAKELADLGADAIINISASPFTKTKPSSRQEMLQNHASQLGLPIFYANQAGANTELIFDGDSMVIDAESAIVARAPLFKAAYVDVSWNLEQGGLCNLGEPPAAVPEKEEGLFRGLVTGLKDYLRKTGIADKVILGLSGGIDSALVACIAAEALGSENVIAITMPSEFSSEGSVTDSEKLAENLGIQLHRIPVKDIYDEYVVKLEPLFAHTSFGVAEENLQSRIRGALLMAISNKFGYMLLNTGNKSELATGYCTLYGDMAGGLGLISDLYKTEVYEVAHWLNEAYFKREIIPEQIISKPPSAELRPDQKDADSLPEYDVLDKVLKSYIEDQQSLQEITDCGFEKKVVQKVIRLVDQTEFKRFQGVPGLKVSTKAFGTGRRWPIVQKWSNNQLDDCC